MLSGLRAQTFTDFELVLVDALYSRRHELLADTFGAAGIKFVHTPPRTREFPRDAIPPACNAAIAKANSPILLWMTDYTWAPSQCLETHWSEYESIQWCGSGAHDYVLLPELAFGYPAYAPKYHGYEYLEDKSWDYVNDIQAGVYDKYMYSVFKEPITTQAQIDALLPDPVWGKDPKLAGLIGGYITGDAMHLKNESTSLVNLLKVNGLDEEYRSHIYPDIDLGFRLEAAGEKWRLIYKTGWVKILNARHLFPHLPWRGGLEDQRWKHDKVKSNKTGMLHATNPYELTRVRELAPFWYA